MMMSPKWGGGGNRSPVEHGWIEMTSPSILVMCKGDIVAKPQSSSTYLDVDPAPIQQGTTEVNEFCQSYDSTSG